MWTFNKHIEQDKHCPMQVIENHEFSNSIDDFVYKLNSLMHSPFSKEMISEAYEKDRKKRMEYANKEKKPEKSQESKKKQVLKEEMIGEKEQKKSE